MDLIKYGYNGRLLTILQDDKGNPWWVAREICDVLGLTNVTVALEGLDADEKSELKKSLSSGGRRPIIINEPGLYSLIFKCRKPEAKAFKTWVTREVLPAIRKTGGYIHGGDEVKTHCFRNVAEVLNYVQSSGLNIKKSKIYLDIHKELLRREVSGTFLRSAVDQYISGHRERGGSKYSGDNIEIACLYSNISRQQCDIKNILETSLKIAKILGHSKKDASLIAQAKVEEATGIRLSEIYTLPSGQKQIEHVEQNKEGALDDDLVEDFIDDCCELGDDFKSSLNVLYERFCEWFVYSVDDIPPYKNKFSEYLSTFIDRTQHVGTIFHGIKLLAN